MEALGYIISSRKIKDLLDGIEIVNKVDNVPNNMPYLIVGLNEAKKNIQNFNILNHQISNNSFWTFGKTERRNDYENDINNFYKYIINNIINNIKYYYVNILTIKYNKIKKLLLLLKSSKDKYIYISNGMIYIYTNGYVLGLSLKIIKYCGIKEEKILKFLQKNNFNHIFYNDMFLSVKFKSMIKNNRYLIPYFKSIA